MDDWAVKEIRAKREPVDQPYTGDVAFLAKHFTEIPAEEAERRNPNLVAVHIQLEALGRGTAAYFECDAYDWEKKSCGAYEERPKTCSMFPYYGAEFRESWPTNPAYMPLMPFDHCGYWDDLQPTQRLFSELTPLQMA